jgi:DNA-binding CsgD family transcriptional regulator
VVTTGRHWRPLGDQWRPRVYTEALEQAYRFGVTVVGVPSFLGRAQERASLDGLLDRVRDGESAVLIIRGEAGIGKTALLQYCARQASGCRVARIAGIESELEMPFAALHQLCTPMLGELGALPEPQQQALRVAFGLAPGRAPDRFLVGLAVLGLLAERAAERPLVCLVDDAQWLDEPSRQVLGFVGRRLMAEAVLLVAAVRETGDEQLFALPALSLDGLSKEDARALIRAVVPGHLDEQVRDRIVAETRGNPLRLLELPREMNTAELAGGFGTPGTGTVAGPIEEHYARRVSALPASTQRLLLLAAADPTGDATLLWRAAQTLGVARDAAAAAESEQLLELGSQVRFRHPLVRSTVYATAERGDRAAAHSALAAATDVDVDPERRVWHLAAAATGPDEAVASQLERLAATAQARAGLAGAAAFLERSVQLTAEPERRAERVLAAAHAQMHAGAFGAARALLAEAQALATDDVQRAQIERLRGQVQYASDPGPEAAVLLVEAAGRLESLDADLARETYLDAWFASFAAGPYAPSGGLLAEVSRAARSAPPASESAAPCVRFLDPNAKVVTDGRAAAAADLRSALDPFLADEASDGDFLQWGHLITHTAAVLWDGNSWGSLLAKHVELARASGALTSLAMALNGRGMFAAWCGDFEATAAIIAECDAINEATGIGARSMFSAGGPLLAAYQGRPEALPLMSAGVAAFLERGLGHGVQYMRWTTAILCNGLGRYAEALAAAELAAYEMEIPNGTGWALVEVIEAAVRSHRPDVAREAMEQLPKHTLEDSDWAMGLEARSRALVSEGDEAERWYEQAVERLARTPFRTELGRAHLLYGEWLRRAGRRVHAREQLTDAYELFSAIGAEAFAERARRERVATGEKVRKRDVATLDQLTPQEEHIARLARDGRSNAEIGAELFLSVRTVEWHLRKVFIKLGVRSRKDLKDALPSRGRNPALTA